MNKKSLPIHIMFPKKQMTMKSGIFQYLIFLLLFFPAAYSQEVSSTHDTVLLDQLQQEIRTLKIEMASLKADVDSLKLLLQRDKVEKCDVVEMKSTGFWLSKSGKRHNTSCRYYGCKGGRPCKPDEGVACKKCGG